MKFQRYFLNRTINELELEVDSRQRGIDAGFKQSNDNYIDAYYERKKDEDDANDAEKKLIKNKPSTTLKEFEAQNKDGQYTKNLYISKPKLEVIANYYNAKKGARRAILKELYKIDDFVDRATRGYFPKNGGLDAIRDALDRPLSKNDFVPTPNTPLTLPGPKKGKGMPMKGSGRHTSWRDKFLT